MPACAHPVLTLWHILLSSATFRLREIESGREREREEERMRERKKERKKERDRARQREELREKVLDEGIAVQRQV